MHQQVQVLAYADVDIDVDMAADDAAIDADEAAERDVQSEDDANIEEHQEEDQAREKQSKVTINESVAPARATSVQYYNPFSSNFFIWYWLFYSPAQHAGQIGTATSTSR